MRARPFLLLTLDLPPEQDGGIGTLVDVLARGMEARGRPAVVVTRGRRGSGVEGETERPYRLVRLPGRSWRRWSDLWLALGLPWLLLALRPRAAICATWELARVPRRLGALFGVPTWVLASGRDVTAALTPRRERLRARVLGRADRVLALSRWMAGELAARGVPGSRITVFQPGILPPPPRSVVEPDAAPTAICLGRLVPRKGQDRLIAAWPEVRRRVPGARLLLVGRGPDGARLRARAREAGVEDAVEFAGHLRGDALEAAWTRARVYAMPCREEAGGDTEGYGLTFLEAGARGLPVVAGTTGGVPEAVDDGVTGVLVDPGDEGALVEALVGLLTDPERARALGAAGRERALGRHSPGKFADSVLEGVRWRVSGAWDGRPREGS